MRKLRSLFLATLALAFTVTYGHAQLTHPQDPANLTGEHLSPQSLADTLPLNHGAPALQQLLLKLRTRASMMMIVAHPDDEDGGLLTLESRGAGARVAMLTLTRGEGGQNLMSADFNDALGLIRTQELLAADRFFGVDQFFGTEVDFGFSKTREESLQKWTHDRVLYDAVRAVRLYRPLVLASVFVGGPTDGHGHHQVAGEIAQEVFLAAADPNVFPEMIAQGLLPWSPLKVYARTPFSRVGPQGMFDPATGQTIPTRFHNYITGTDTSTEPTPTVLIHEGDPATVTFPGQPAAPALAMDGLTYVQFARLGLALQKTQIGANVRLAPPGRSDTGYTLMAARIGCPTSSRSEAEAHRGLPPFCPPPANTAEQSLFDGVDISLPSLADLAPTAPPSIRLTLVEIDHNLAQAQRLFSPAHLELTAPPLRDSLRLLDSLLLEVEALSLPPVEKFNLLHELRIKRVQLNNALVLALGLDLRASTPLPAFLSTRPSVEVLTHLSTRAGQHLNCRLISVGPTLLEGGKLTACSPTSSQNLDPPSIPSADIARLIGSHFRPRPLTRPYFSRTSLEQPFYTLSNPALRNAPAAPPQFVPSRFDSEGVPLDLAAAVEPTLPPGSPKTLAQPVDVVPPVSVSVSPTLGIVTPSETSLRVTASIHAGPTQYGDFRFPVPSGWQVTPRVTRWSLDRPAPSTTSASDTNRIPFTLTVPPPQPDAPRSSSVTATATFEGDTYAESFRPVGYPGLTYTNMYAPATYKAVAVDVRTAPNLKIAFLPGTGDDVPDFLPSLGITPTRLNPQDLTASNAPDTLKQFDAILLGVRAYAAHPELAGPGSKPLLDYARNGGIVILQYMTARFGDAEAPFPISVPGDPAHNVVVEAQPVTLLQPASPLLTWPNKITSADFDHWVEERGHGFAASWSPEFQPLLEVHDPDQDPQQGGLLLARTGKGAFLYCALALYRQLPEGVPGAYRLLANLLSYAKNPAR